MTFISIQYVIFFIIVLALYFSLPFRFRWILLLIASYIFYGAWNAGYLLLLILTTTVDFFVAQTIYRTDKSHSRRRKLLLSISLAVNFGVLFIFKYFNFFNESLAAVLPAYEAVALDVLLPVGISFYVFQSVAYIIDVYRGDMKPEENPGIFAAFVAFFPQLVAGPIERAPNLLSQFHKHFNFNYDRAVSGLRLILWGVFKKVVIADRAAVYVNMVYNDVHTYNGLPLIAATIFFAFQIYCDFSGYSDIAIGSARIMGFSLMDNFRQPYLSQSIREFWRRWHISLSTWFRDYLYIPLGGSRVSLSRNLLNLMIVFTVSGLWHGAKWTFVIWGALHGLVIVAEVLLNNRQKQPLKIPAVFKMALTFSIVTFAWIFFRANSLDDATYIISHLFDFSGTGQTAAQPLINMGLAFASAEFTFLVVMIALLMLLDWIDARWGLMDLIGQYKPPIRWVLYYGFAILIAYSLVASDGPAQTFIYFQF